MFAHGCLLELIPDPGTMAAAVANATTALTKGLSAANQKFVFMLIISSILRSAFQKELKFSCTRSCQDWFASKIMLA